MDIDPKPPGLLSRRMFPIYRGRVCVEERWDIEVPGCPLIKNPWSVNPLEGRFVVRQREMTVEDFNNSKIELF